MALRAILFDLDGTLVPMDYEQFVKTYFGLLVKKVAPLGYDPEALVAAVWKGTRAMITSDGASTCEETFWSVFAGEMGSQVYDHKELFNQFYREEFDQARMAVGPNPLAVQAVALARQKAERVILATNSIFPLDGIRTRLNWVGLKPEDFDFVTSYEQVHACKPNPNYYREILSHCGLAPEDCLMIGNDIEEDIQSAGSLGIATWLVKDCIIGDESTLARRTPGGSFAQLIDFLSTLSSPLS